MMTIKEARMREAGRIAGEVHETVKTEAKPGVALITLDKLAGSVINDHGANSALRDQGFPGNISISLNKEILYGIPDTRVIEEGDLISVDTVLHYKGIFVDKARTFIIPPEHYEKKYVVTAARQCFADGLAILDSSIRDTGKCFVKDIGRAIEARAQAMGIVPIRELYGHVIGEEPHSHPFIPNFYDQENSAFLIPGMYVAIEPLVFYGKYYFMKKQDITLHASNWSSHWEDTIVIHKDSAEVIT